MNEAHDRGEIQNEEEIEQMDFQEILKQSDTKKWNELSFWEKIAIFNYCHIVFLLSDLFLITGCLIMLIIKQEAFMMADVFIGFGCFFAWCSLLGFLRAGPVLDTALPRGHSECRALARSW